MAIEIQGRVGPQIAADGTALDPRMTRDGALAVAACDGQFSELVLRGQVYTASTAAAGISLAATHVSPLAAGTGTPIIGVFNPLNSGVVLKILKVRIASISGTPGGPFVWNVIPALAGLSSAIGQLGLNNKTFVPGGAARAVVGAALAGSVLATMFGVIGGPSAVALGAGVNSIEAVIDGLVQVQPGCFLGVAATAAGTTHVASAMLTWAEAPIALAG